MSIRWHHIYIYIEIHIHVHKSYLQSHDQGTTHFTFHITLGESSKTRQLWSAAQDQLTYPPTLLSRGLIVRGNIFRRPVLVRQCACSVSRGLLVRGKIVLKVRGNICRCPILMRQCACPTARILCTRQIENNKLYLEQQVTSSKGGTHNPVRHIYNTSKCYTYITCGQDRASKWHTLKKSTIRLLPDDDSLDRHVERTNYITYCRLHYHLLEHLSPIGHGWEMRDGKCRAMCYTLPSLPKQLILRDYSAKSSHDSSSDEMSECGESTDSDED